MSNDDRAVGIDPEAREMLRALAEHQPAMLHTMPAELLADAILLYLPRAEEATPPAVLRVGEALARGEVQRGEAVVEWQSDDGQWWQARPPFREWYRWWPTGWRECGVPDPEEYALPCRLVPLDQADADPATRGPL
jgi:hypothetical protein